MSEFGPNLEQYSKPVISLEKKFEKCVDIRTKTDRFFDSYETLISSVDDISKVEEYKNSVKEICQNDEIFGFWLDSDKVKNAEEDVQKYLLNKKNDYFNEKEKETAAFLKPLVPKSDDILIDINDTRNVARYISSNKPYFYRHLNRMISCSTDMCKKVYEDEKKTGLDFTLTREYGSSRRELITSASKYLDQIIESIKEDDDGENITKLELINWIRTDTEDKLIEDKGKYSRKDLIEINKKCIDSFINNFDLIQKNINSGSYIDHSRYKLILKESLNNPFEQIFPDQIDLMAEKIHNVWKNSGSGAALEILSEVMPDSLLCNKAMDKILSSYGISTEISLRLRNSWDLRVEDKNEYANVLDRNLLRIAYLESVSPGCVQTLYSKFGICNFDRYPTEVLIEQVKNIDKNEINYGIVVFPRYDHNNAFSYDENILKKINKGMSENETNMEIYESEGRVDIVKTFLNARKRHTDSKIKYLILGGHGNPETIAFGKSQNRLDDKIYKKADTLDENNRIQYINEILENNKRMKHVSTGDLGGNASKFIADSLEDDAQILLISCSTGVENGIAQKISEVAGKNISVIAPNKDTSLIGIEIKHHKFIAQYHNADAMIYKGGKLQ